MARRVSETTRAAVIAEVSAGKKRAAVARRHRISETTVKKILRAAKVIPLPMTEQNRTKTRAATEATQLLARQRRSDLMVRCLDEAERILMQLRKPSKVYDFGGRAHEYIEHELPEPDARSKRDLAIAFGILIDKSIALDKANEEGAGPVRAAIIDLVDRLTADESRTALTIEDSTR